MTIGPLAALLGGLGLFLLGMARLTDGLKVAAGPALKDLLERWTRTRLRGLLAGVLITAVVQSSSAVTVATVGFVNAGLLSLSQAVWLIFGTNIGTTMTAWLVAMVGVKLDMAALALPLIGVGVAFEIGGRSRARLAGLGEALSGFGLFFLGLGILASGFASLSAEMPRLEGDGLLMLGGSVLLGFALTVLTQSSSAAIAIALTAAAGGTLGLLPAAAVVIGTNIGTTSTAGFAALGATAAARRVVMAHVAFNLITGIAALAMLKPLLALAVMLATMVNDTPAMATVLAVFHTLFNVMGVLLMWPLTGRLVHWLEALFISGEAVRALHLDRNLLAVPSLALNGLAMELADMARQSFGAALAVLRGGSPGEAALVRDNVLTLGEMARDFVARMGGEGLPADMTGAVADLIRATQHIEETAIMAAQLRPQTVPAGLELEWRGLAEATAAALMLSGATPVADRLAAVEVPYQRLKALLLAQTAAGRLSPAAMEAALEHAKALRRTAEAALKAQRRLLPWLADTAEIVEMPATG